MMIDRSHIHAHDTSKDRPSIDLLPPESPYPPTPHTQLNPYQWIDGLYDESLKEAYFLNEDLQGLPPHVFAVSAAAYRCVLFVVYLFVN